MTKRRDSYKDYSYRLQEVIRLLKLGLKTSNASLAESYGKAATILSAAALERFVNDVLHEACLASSIPSWSSLTPGLRDYLCTQIGIRLTETGSGITEQNWAIGKKEQKISDLANDIANALRDPRTWSYHVRFGMFMDGAAAPEKLDKTLSRFGTKGKSFLDSFDDTSLDKSAILRGIAQLIEARHGVAHALRGSPSCSPSDAKIWMLASFWVVKRILSYLA